MSMQYREYRQQIIEGQTTVSDKLADCIDQYKKNQHLNAFITYLESESMQAAEIADKLFKQGEARPLEGYILAVKDNFCTRGVRTTAASKMLQSFVPEYDATVVKRLKDAGAIIIGKTNLDEFAMGSSTETSFYGPTYNPCIPDSRLSPGGSSGGSAASVVANLALGALGSDTGGSIRQPAALCGAVGFKPTYGRCSRYGMIAFASSLDQAGPITSSVYDAALLFKYMAGEDTHDATSLNWSVPLCTDSNPIKGMTIGIPKEYALEGLHEDVKALWDKAAEVMRSMGATVKEISLPHTKYTLPTYYIIAPAEASSNLARYDGVHYGYRSEKALSLKEVYTRSRTEAFGDEVRRRLMIGTHVLSAASYDEYFLHAQKVRRKITNDFLEVFRTVDLILTPTVSGPAFNVGEKNEDPLALYLQDIFTCGANLAGLPAISVPGGNSSNGLPLGMQLIGNYGEEKRLFDGAYALEEGLVV